MAWWQVDPASLGDPAGMRAFAAQLQSSATEILNAGAGARRARKGNALVGPWGRSFNSILGRSNRTIESSADELRALASYVRGKANEVEREQQAIVRERERQRQLELQRQRLELERQRLEAARRSSGGGGGGGGW